MDNEGSGPCVPDGDNASWRQRAVPSTDFHTIFTQY